jgi:hypothetical protein
VATLAACTDKIAAGDPLNRDTARRSIVLEFTCSTRESQMTYVWAFVQVNGIVKPPAIDNLWPLTPRYLHSDSTTRLRALWPGSYNRQVDKKYCTKAQHRVGSRSSLPTSATERPIAVASVEEFPLRHPAQPSDG